MKKILSFTSRKISRAIFEYKMFNPGDRILTAVSGGKDSMILAWNIHKMMKSFPIQFHADFIHIKTNFSDPQEEQHLKEKFREWKIPLIHLEINMEDPESPQKLNCFKCSSVRRRTLLTFAAENGYDALALGHHMDDILESLFMNMVYNKEVSVMVPHLKYDEGPLRLVRPLSLLAESHLEEAARRLTIPDKSCRCPYEKESRRKHVRKVLDLLTGNSPSLKNNMYLALCQLKTEYLPQGALEKILENYQNRNN